LPSVQLPDLNLASDPASIHEQDIELAAQTIRRHWRLGDGPIPNLVTLLESKGCGITAFAFGAEKLDAFSQYAEERPFIAITTDKESAARVRFDAAHELGHLVLHRHVPSRVAMTPEYHKLMERQAHRFGAAFLFPSTVFGDEVYSLAMDALVAVKRRWKVSMQGIMRRAKDLGLVNQDRYERACRDLSRRGYRTKEPLDDEIVPERPVTAAKSIKMLVEQGGVTRADILHKIPLSANDIEVLSQLPHGYLSAEDWGELVQLRHKPAPVTASHVADTTTPRVGAQVIAFPRRPT